MVYKPKPFGKIGLKFYSFEVKEMKKTLLKIFAVCLCLCMVIPAFASCAKKNDKFVIGVSGPLTGAASVYGVAVKNSAQMAVDEINAAGGLNGVLFELIATDDQHDATKVAANYNNMMEQGMHVALGCVTTAPCLEFKKLSKEDNVFFLTPSASGDAVPEFDNAYQMCFADGNQGSVAANYVNSLNLTEVGIFYKSDDPYSDGIYKQFKENLAEGITTVEASFTGDAADFTTQINSLKDCSFIFMPIYYTPASQFMRQAKGIVADDATYYGCDGFDGLEGAFTEEAPISTIPQEIIMLSHFNSKATDGKAGDFVKKYTEKFGADTLNQFGASAYDCVYAIFGAMKAAADAGEDIDVNMSASDLCEILKKQFNGGYSLENGATGQNITWESTGYVKKGAIAYPIKAKNA